MGKVYKIFSWNVNGIRAVVKKGFLEWINDAQPDILIIQETKANRDQVPKQLLNLEGYYQYWNSAVRKGYSGVATFSKIKPLSVEKGMGIKRFDDEGRILITKYSEFTLLNVYFPNGKKDDERLKYKLEFYDAFLEFAESLRAKGERIVIGGDVNTAHKPIDLARPKQNEKISGFLPIERKWIDKLLSKGYVDTLRHFTNEPGLYTWWSVRARGARERNVGWRIDYFFISEDLVPHLKDAKIHSQVQGSDHCPISITLEF